MNMGTASEGVIINALWILIPVTCWIVTLWIYGSIFIAQHETLNRGGGGVAARRMVVLALRAAIFVPVVATLTLVSLFAPLLFDGLEVLSAVCEGYAIRCFFLLLVQNCGGLRGAVDHVRNGNGVPEFLQFASPRRGYVRICLMIWQFAWIRPCFSLSQSVCNYVDSCGDGIWSLLSVGGALSCMIAMMCLTYFATCTWETCRGLNVGWKFAVVKGAVAVVLTEAGILFFFSTSGVWTLGPSDLGLGTSYDTERERFITLYCGVVLLELAIIAFILDIAFAPTMVYSRAVMAGGDSKADHAAPTRARLLYEVLDITDAAVGGDERLYHFGASRTDPEDADEYDALVLSADIT